MGLSFFVAAPASAAPAAGTVNDSMEREFASLLNQERTARGLPALGVSLSIRDVARTWSGTMAGEDRLQHNPNMASQIGAIDPGWRSIGENVGVGSSVAGLHQALMNSQGHRDNILGAWTYVTVGVVVQNGRVWVTQNFIRTATPHALVPSPAPAPAATESVWYLRNAPSNGKPDAAVAYGMTSYRQLSCDWDGNGTDTLGVYTNGSWYLRNDTSPGAPNIVVSYGWNGPTPVCGDWNGDGIETIGLYDKGQWLLRDSNTPGRPERAFSYGWSAADPVVGDWNGDGRDGVGVYASGSWYLRETPSAGGPQQSPTYGYNGAVPVVGDWDGNGADSIGVFDRGNWSLRQDTSGGMPHLSVSYGWSGTKPIVGDWNADNASGIAVVNG